MRFGKNKTPDLQGDLGQLLDDLRELLSSTDKAADPALTQVRHKVEAALGKVRESSAQAVEQSKALAHDADNYLHESPWQAVGGALAVGALIGFMLSRR